METLFSVTSTPKEKAYAYALIDVAIRTHHAVASAGEARLTYMRRLIGGRLYEQCAVVITVIATAHCSYRRPLNNVNHRGRQVRPAQRDQMGGGGKRTRDMRHMARRKESQPDTVCSLAIFSSQPPRGGEKARLCGESRRAERLLSPISRMGSSTDRDESDDDLSEGGFPLPPARPESHRSRGQARSTRPAHACQPC
jgi:hypothetical protein